MPRHTRNTKLIIHYTDGTLFGLRDLLDRLAVEGVNLRLVRWNGWDDGCISTDADFIISPEGA